MHLVPLDTNRHLIPNAATAAARAFTYDSLFLWLRPYGGAPELPPGPDPVYPPSIPGFEQSKWFRHLRDYFLQRMRKDIANYNIRLFAAVSDASDSWYNGFEAVMGHATWTREWVNENPSKEERERREKTWLADSLWKRIERAALGWEKWYWEGLKFDNSYEPKNLKRFNDEWSTFFVDCDRFLKEGGRNKMKTASAAEEWPGNGLGSGEGYVWLQFLAVDPQYQRKGVGGLLMSWGMECAKEEDVPAGLTASTLGQGLYRKWSFEDVGWGINYGVFEDNFMVAWVKPKGSDEKSSKVEEGLFY